MDRQQKIIIFVMAVLLLVALVVMLVLLCGREAPAAPEFDPPSFDKAAISGLPTDVPEELNYGSPSTQSEFKFSLCGTPEVTEDNRLRIYFTSPATNKVWLLIKIYDTEGALIGESGLLRPDEYVEHVQLEREVARGSDIVIKVLSYEVDTYYSKGTIQGALKIAE